MYGYAHSWLLNSWVDSYLAFDSSNLCLAQATKMAIFPKMPAFILIKL
jgi:hypothetical protein